MSAEEQKKIFEKIQKCLNLGTSTNSHEAAAALRQAQKLMSMHGISEADLSLAGYSDKTVECPIQANIKKIPLHLNRFLNLIESAFGVKAIIGANIRISDASYRIRYFGPTHRVEMAAYAHTVMFRAMNSAWAKFLAAHPNVRGHRGARMSFMLGWISAIDEKVTAIGFPENEVAATDLAIKNFYGKELDVSKSSGTKWFGAIGRAGADAAASFEINRPMGQNFKQLT